MFSLTSILTLVHLLGLALGVGAATVKLVLLVKCKADASFVPVFFKVAKPITKQIILGLALLTLSGIGWLLLGYGFDKRLIVKIVLVTVIWVLGPIIDNVLEPKFRRLAPAPGESASPEFTRAQNQYMVWDFIAGGLFYVILLIWLLR